MDCIVAHPSLGSNEMEVYTCASSKCLPGPEQVATKCFCHLSPAHPSRDSGRRGRVPVGKGAAAESGSLGPSPALPLVTVLLGKVFTSVRLFS